MKIIVGLGNPGDKYIKTRHNIGFMILDYFMKEKDFSWKMDKKFNAFIIKEGETIYLKPLTFMNDSGISVQKVMSFYNLLPKKMGILKQKNTDLADVLTVIHDDLDIEFGSVKTSVNRGSAGHNGIKSIINHLKTKNFNRLRIGIKGEKPEQMAVSDYVLSSFSKEEIDELYKNIIPKIEI